MKLRALRVTGTKVIKLPITKQQVSIDYLKNNKIECANELSKTCLSIFEGNKEHKSTARILDFLSYADIISENARQILEQINHHEK